MKDAKYFADGFKQLGEKTKQLEEVNSVISNGSLKDLRNKLSEIKQLADSDRKDETKQSIKAWLFIIASIFTIYMSINFSLFWLILSVPVSLLSIVIIVAKYLKNPMYLLFKFDSGMMDYIQGKKTDAMGEPKYSYIYMEKRLQIKISNFQNS